MTPMNTMLQTAETDVARTRKEVQTAEATLARAVQAASKLDTDEAQQACALARKRHAVAESYRDSVLASQADAVEAQAKANKVKAVDRALVPALEAAKQFVLAHNRSYEIMTVAFAAYIREAGGHIDYPTETLGVDPKRPRNIDQLVAVASELAAVEERNAFVQRMADAEAAAE